MIFKVDGFIRYRRHISAEHWSTDQRETSHLTDIPVPREHLDNFKIKYERARIFI